MEIKRDITSAVTRFAICLAAHIPCAFPIQLPRDAQALVLTTYCKSLPALICVVTSYIKFKDHSIVEDTTV